MFYTFERQDELNLITEQDVKDWVIEYYQNGGVIDTFGKAQSRNCLVHTFMANRFNLDAEYLFLGCTYGYMKKDDDEFWPQFDFNENLVDLIAKFDKIGYNRTCTLDEILTIFEEN